MVRRLSLFSIHLSVLFALLSEVYLFLKYYLWAMALWFILFYSLHVSIIYKKTTLGHEVLF